jgi:hypothetical protein
MDTSTREAVAISFLLVLAIIKEYTFMSTLTIDADQNLLLVREDGYTENDTVRYAETRFGHETGNSVEVSADATPADVMEAYFAL